MVRVDGGNLVEPGGRGCRWGRREEEDKARGQRDGDFKERRMQDVIMLRYQKERRYQWNICAYVFTSLDEIRLAMVRFFRRAREDHEVYQSGDISTTFVFSLLLELATSGCWQGRSNFSTYDSISSSWGRTTRVMAVRQSTAGL